jgi:hypothetical protein
MAKAMKRRDVESALRGKGCNVVSDKGDHTKWGCRCGAHTAPVPRHLNISPGVVRDIIRRMECLEEGWLQ